MTAPFEYDLGHVREPPMLYEPKVEVEILCGMVDGAVAPRRQQRLSTHHERRVGNRAAVPQQQARFDGLVVERDPRATDRTTLAVDQQDVSAHGDAIAMGVEMLDLTGEALGHGDVVGIHAGDQLGRGGRHRLAQCRGQAARRLSLEPKAGVELRDGAGDLRGAIRRPVVHDETREVREGLDPQALQCVGQRGLGIAGAQKHRDTRRACRPRLSELVCHATPSAGRLPRLSPGHRTAAYGSERLRPLPGSESGKARLARSSARKTG